MSTTAVTVRQLDEPTKARLRMQAARNGRSMEAEIREILKAALQKETPKMSLVESIRLRFEPFGGVDLEIPPRGQSTREIEF